MPGNTEKELIKNIIVKVSDGRLHVDSICERLTEIGYPIRDSLIYYFSPCEDLYIFVSQERLLKNASAEGNRIPLEVIVENRLHMKFLFED